MWSRRKYTKWTMKFFYFWIRFFFWKTWISRRVSYFVGILSGVRNIFLLNCPQVLSLLNVGFRGIFKPHKTQVQKGESCYK